MHFRVDHRSVCGMDNVINLFQLTANCAGHGHGNKSCTLAATWLRPNENENFFLSGRSVAPSHVILLWHSGGLISGPQLEFPTKLKSAKGLRLKWRLCELGGSAFVRS